jgi:hypothetical protein
LALGATRAAAVQAKDKKGDVPEELFLPMRFGPAIFVGLAAALLENFKL